MARNGSGTYSKVNTFVAGNTITAAGHNENWDDLVTEMTNSVAADGQTSMTGALKASNGAVGSPSVTFASDTNTGLYRIGADNIGISAGGTKIVDVSTTAVGITGTLTASGAVTASSTANVVGNFSVATNKFNVTAASGNTSVAGTLTVTGVADFADGTNSLPSIANTGDLNTGIYFPAADEVGVTAGGTQRARFTSAGAIVTGAITASTSIASTTSITAGNSFTVSAGTVTLPADSVAAAALAAPAAWVCIETQAASNSATIDLTTGLGDTLYDAFCIVISNAKPASDDQEFWLRIGTGAGPTYQAGASDYGWAISGGFATDANDAADSEITLTYVAAGTAVGNASGESWSGTLYFNNPEASNMPTFHGTCAYIDANGAVKGGFVGGSYLAATAITGIRFLFESGNIASGRFTLYGLTKTA